LNISRILSILLACFPFIFLCTVAAPIVDPEGPPLTDDEDGDDSDTDGNTDSDIKAAGGSSGIGTAAIVASSVAGAVLLIGALAVRRRVANRNAEAAELEANESSGMDTTALSGAAAAAGATGLMDVTPVENEMPEEEDVEDELADDDDVESSFDNV